MQPQLAIVDEFMLTFRRADENDVKFCYDLVISEVEHGHFDEKLKKFIYRIQFRSFIKKSILSGRYKAPFSRRRRPCSFYIFEKDGKKIGFSSVISHGHGEIELWLFCVHINYRGNGFGKEMVMTSINRATMEYRPKNTDTLFVVRAYKKSVEMISILRKLGFYIHTGFENNVVLRKEYRPQIIK